VAIIVNYKEYGRKRERLMCRYLPLRTEEGDIKFKQQVLLPRPGMFDLQIARETNYQWLTLEAVCKVLNLTVV
jgi:hypothetical protein